MVPINRGVLSGLGPGDAPDVLTSDAGRNSVLTAAGSKEYVGTAAALNADLVPSTDVRGYQSFSLILTGTFTATVRVQGSNDNGNWDDIYLQRLASMTTPTLSTSSANLVYLGGLGVRYLRVRVTAYTSGTASGVLELSSMPLAPTLRQVVLATSAAVFGQSSLSDTLSNGNGVLYAGSHMIAYNGGSWDRLRTPNTFKTVAATSSGNTALWTPTSGKKFRLMCYRLELSADAATSGGALVTLKFQDATTDMAVAHSVYVPAVSGTAFGNGYQPGWVDFGNGILSAAADRVLNVNLSAALSSGTCRVMCAGCEE